jgi:hypothetical protein
MHEKAARVQHRDAPGGQVLQFRREHRHVKGLRQATGIPRACRRNLEAGRRPVCQVQCPRGRLEGQTTGDVAADQDRTQQSRVPAATIGAGHRCRRELPHAALTGRQQPATITQAGRNSPGSGTDTGCADQLVEPRGGDQVRLV